MPKFKIWEHHNPKIAEPYMKDLLKKLSESSRHWDSFSECDSCMANVSLEYKENTWIHIQIPNSKIIAQKRKNFQNSMSMIAMNKVTKLLIKLASLLMRQ